MNKSRVRLGPHLMAQTCPTPQTQKPNYIKTFGTAIIIIIAILAIQHYSHSTPGNNQLPQNEAVLGAEAVVTEDFYIYQVEANDSLFSLSQKFKVPWEELVSLNSLTEPFTLTPGQKLKIPYSTATRQQRFYENLKKKIYVVEEGDSFVGIAQKLNISVTELLRANPELSSPNFIRVGQILHLP